MAGEKELKIKITAESAQFLQGVKSAENSLKGFSDKAKVHTTAISSGLGSMSSMLGAIGVTFGAASVVTFLKNSATAAIESERATSRLKATIDNIGTSYDSHAQEIQKAVLASAQYAMVQDEEVSDVLQKLVLQTGNLKTSLSNLNLTMDIARQANVDYDTAAMMLSKVLTGNVEAAGRYFPALKNVVSALGDTATAHDKAEAGMKFLRDKVEGATGQMGEYEKSIAKVTKQWEDFKEKVGAPVIETFSKTTTAIQNAFAWLEKFREKWRRDWAFTTGTDLWIPELKKSIPYPYNIDTPVTTPEPAIPGKTSAGNGPDTDAQKKLEDAHKKRMDALERHATEEFKFEGEMWDMRWKKIEENTKKWSDAWEQEKVIGEQRLAMIEEETRLTVESAKEKEDAITGSLAFIARSALSEHKAFFAITKAANISMAYIDTMAAATKALTAGPFLGPILAGIIKAAGLANIAAIASTSFGGRGGGGSAAGSATSGAGIGAQGSTFVANQPTRSVQVVVHGNIIDHAAFVRELQPYFREVAIDTV